MSAGSRRLVAVPDLVDPELSAAIEQRFVREAELDRWVQAHGRNLRAAYEERASAWTMLALAQSPWMTDEGESRLGDRAVACVASAVAASVQINLEPACARLLWVSEHSPSESDALEAAEHYALLGLAAAKRASEREAAECVREAARFLRDRSPMRASVLHRFTELAERRLVHAAALVGAHLPFWRFPFAYRWSRDAPLYGRGPRGMAEPVSDAGALGVLSLAYRSGKGREEIAGALERCAVAFRREPALDALAHARGTAAIADFAAALSSRWSVAGATSPADVIDRIAPRVLASPWLMLGEAPARAVASRVATPVLARVWPDLMLLAEEHARFLAEQRQLSAVA